MTDYSIVIPVYNSEDTLGELFQRIKKVFEQRGDQFEVIFIDDGSKDKSWEVITQLKQESGKNLIAIKLSKNFGQHNAILCGFNFCKGKYIITIDDDLQIPPEEISVLINKQKETEADVVYGVFPRKRHSLFRNIGSYLVKKSFYYLTGATGSGSSFRLISLKVVENIKNYKQNFIFIDEILHWQTSHIESVDVEHLPRKKGRSGYSTLKLIKLALNLVVNYSVFPLRLMIWMGLFSSFIFFALGIFSIWKKLRLDVPLGYTSIIVSIFFVGSVILVCLGVIGEYIGRIYTMYNNKPQYSIKKVLR